MYLRQGSVFVLFPQEVSGLPVHIIVIFFVKLMAAPFPSYDLFV